MSRCLAQKSEWRSVSTKDILSVIINNSSFSKLEASGNHNVKITNVFKDFTFDNKNTFVEISNSTINIKNCSFTGNSSSTQAVIMKANVCHIVMRNITIENLKARNALIHVGNSKLNMYQTSLSRNGFRKSSSAILIANKSLVHVQESFFQSNMGTTGSCLFVEGHSSLQIEKSIFYNNIGIHSGGVIFSNSKSTISIRKSNFMNNSVWYFADEVYQRRTFPMYSGGGGVIKTEDSVHVAVESGLFINNSCLNMKRTSKLSSTGGVINVAYFSTLSVFNSTFEGNFAEYGGSVLGVYSQSNMTVQQSLFRKNSGQNTSHVVSCICDEALSNHTISTSSFVFNTGGIHMGGHAVKYLHIDSCLFQSNVGESVVYLSQTRAFLEHTSFQDNGGFVSGVGEELKSIPVDWYVISCHNESSLHATNCSFESNAFAIIHADTSLISLTGCTISSNLAHTYMIYSPVNGSISLQNSKFDNDTEGKIIGAKSAQVNVTGCIFSENKGAISVGINSSLSIETSLFLYNGPGNCITGSHGAFVHIHNCTFSENHSAMGGSLLVVSSERQRPTFCTLRHCLLHNNKQKILLSRLRSIVYWINCSLNYLQYGGDNLVRETIISVESSSRMTIIDSDVHIAPNAVLTVDLSSNGTLMLVRTSIQGFLSFAMKFYNTLHILDSTISYDGTLDYGQFFYMVRSSFLVLRNSIVQWGKSRFFLCGEFSTVSLSNSSITTMFTSKDMVFLGFWNSSVSISNSQLYFAVSNPRITTPPLWIFELYSTQLEMNQTSASLTTDTDVPPQLFWGLFNRCNITLSSCILEGVNLGFTGFQYSHFFIEQSQIYNNSILGIFPGAKYGLIKSSIVRMLPIPCFNDHATPTESVRLANSDVIFGNFVPAISNLMTWKSNLHIGNISVNTSETAAFESVMSMDIFSISECRNINNTFFPRDFAETIYAAGL